MSDDRASLEAAFPDWHLVIKDQRDLGQARSLNYALETVETSHMIYWEDDVILGNSGRWIEQALGVMSDDPRILSVGLDCSVARGEHRRTRDGTKYQMMKVPDRAVLVKPADFIYQIDPWPCFSLRPQVVRCETIREEVGLFDEDDVSHFEYRFAKRYQLAGFRSAALSDVELVDASGGHSSYRDSGQTRSWERMGGLGAWTPLGRRLLRSPVETVRAMRALQRSNY